MTIYLDLSERFRCEPQHAVLRRGDCAQQYREATAAAHGSAIAIRKAVCRGCTVGVVHAGGIGTPPPAVPMPEPAGDAGPSVAAANGRRPIFRLPQRSAKEKKMPKPDRSRDCRDCGKAFQWSAPAQRYCGACKDKRVAAQKGKRKAARRRTDRVQSASAPRTESRATAAASTSSMLEDVTALVRVLARHDATDRERLLASASAILEAVA